MGEAGIPTESKLRRIDGQKPILNEPPEEVGHRLHRFAFFDGIEKLIGIVRVVYLNDERGRCLDGQERWKNGKHHQGP